MHKGLSEIFRNDLNEFFLIAGPCVVENKQVCMDVAGHLKDLSESLDLPIIFKSSFRKANRTRYDSFSGIGDDKALEIIKSVKREIEIDITTDVHSVQDVLLTEDIDLIQIPAFLCRQTDLLVAAGKSKKPVNIKKGQFVSAYAMHAAAEKVRAAGGEYIILTERGNFFGYNDLVVDSRNINEMSQSEITVIDVTHSSQKPNQTKGVTSGNTKYCDLFGKLGIISGASGVFLETHPKPSVALSDSSTMIPLDEVRNLVLGWKELFLANQSIYESNS